VQQRGDLGAACDVRELGLRRRRLHRLVHSGLDAVLDRCGRRQGQWCPDVQLDRDVERAGGLQQLNLRRGRVHRFLHAGYFAMRRHGGNGMWGTAAGCTNQACLQSGSTASCQGVCTPGAIQCMSNGVSTCSVTGTWPTPQPCVNQTCVVSGNTASCV
jgi:hypothetical protein